MLDLNQNLRLIFGVTTYLCDSEMLIRQRLHADAMLALQGQMQTLAAS